MRILLDTNILVRAAQRSHPASRTAADAVKRLHRKQYALCVAPQNVIEFWNVCTRPREVNGLGLSVSATNRYAGRLERICTVLADSIESYREWRKLVAQHSVVGAKVHDARLVATMKVHEIEQILTFNVQDFARYSGITAVHPNTLNP
jgi:predicted nucleic acid-binding protein